MSPQTEERFSSRKFVLSASSLLMTWLALFLDKLEGGEVVALVTLVITAYGAGNLVQRHIERPE